jgi:hypothetical protein
MNREQVVEKVRSAIFENMDLDYVNPNGDDVENATKAILNAILPQVTTVEELEALMASVSEKATPAVVIDAIGRPWTLFEDDRGDWYAQRLGDQDEPPVVLAPLDEDDWPAMLPWPWTVVWQP